MNNFTPEDLIEFYYNESETAKTRDIEAALQESWPLQQKLQVIKEAAERLNKYVERPRSAAVRSIVAYASSFEKTPLS